MQGWLPEWPNGADCKSAGYAFGGSNPSPPTRKEEFSIAKFLFFDCCGQIVVEPFN